MLVPSLYTMPWNDFVTKSEAGAPLHQLQACERAASRDALFAGGEGTSSGRERLTTRLKVGISLIDSV